MGASSCASRVETHLTFPSAADLVVEAEPAFPVAALGTCPSDSRSELCPAEEAEKAWWNDMLIWGRVHRDKVARICKWAVDLGYKAPDHCGD